MLHVHRAERADRLAQALGQLLQEPLEDPFVPEVVAVPTRGMERWLCQRLSAQLGASPGRPDGVCANVHFPAPRRLLGDAVAAAVGVDPAADPWLAERATWPLLEVIDANLHAPWLRRLAVHLGHGQDPPDPVRQARRLGVARRLAERFERYALHRPAMLRAWAAGEDADGSGGRLGPEAAWQAELWRRLRARIGVAGPAERLQRACARLREEPAVVELPRRLAVFGLTRLPAGELEVLRALAAGREIHLYLLHPSPALWDAVAGALAKASPPTLSRRQDPTVELAANHLLRSWGRDAREMQLVLGRAGEQVSHHRGLPRAPSTLLERIQDDVRADRTPPGPPLPGEPDLRPPLESDDRSLEIHACHGRARQVEVLRDAILHHLAEDPSLEVRDVIVMCPDIEAFAPLINAAFGRAEVAAEEEPERPAGEEEPERPAGEEEPERPAGEEEPERRIDLRVRLADRSQRQTNPLLGVLAELLELVDGRLTASQVLGFADREPVRRRFELDDDDLARLQAWVREAGIRWGLDAAHRAPFKLERLAAGTWRSGLDRLLLGVTMTEDAEGLWCGMLPLDDVESSAIELAGRFAELIARLGDAVSALCGRHPIAHWTGRIAHAVDSLAAVGERDAWQREELQRILDELVEQAGGEGSSSPIELGLAEVRALLADRLAGRPTTGSFRTGHLTVCTMYPMRSVPHRVVCLLGLDDGAFPRRSPADGDDLLLEDPHLGERDPRAEDRQLLLDALMAATERLVITYTGNDERTNAPRPPAVPVGELLDVVDDTVRVPEGRARERVVVRHPLQPFDPRNFTPGALVADRVWGFDRVMLSGARAMAGPRRPPRPFLEAPLPDRRSDVLELEELVRFIQRPVREFLRQRLQITLASGGEEIDDTLSIELDRLERWAVGQRLLEARLRGVEPRPAILAEIARGQLPPGILGQPVIAELHGQVEAIVAAVRAHAASARPPSAAAPPVPAGPPSADPPPAAAGPHGAAAAPPAAASPHGAAAPPTAALDLTTPLDVRVPLPDGRLLSGTVGVHAGELLLEATFSRLSARHRLSAWVRLVAATACAPERPFRAVAVGGGGVSGVEVAAIGPLGSDRRARQREAEAQLARLIDLYDRGMREPLPLYCATSTAYAEATQAGEDGLAAAREAWASRYPNGDGWLDGEGAAPEHQLVLGGVRGLDELLAEAPRPDERGAGWASAERTRFGRYARYLCDGLLRWERRGRG